MSEIKRGDIVSTVHSWVDAGPYDPCYCVAVEFLGPEVERDGFFAGQTFHYWKVLPIHQVADGGWEAYGTPHTVENPRLHPDGLALIGRSLQPRIIR